MTSSRTLSRWVLATLLSLAATSASAGVVYPNEAERALTPYSSEAELNAFIGAEPKRCLEVGDGTRLCQWALSRRETGWAPISHAVSSRDRLNLLCVLPPGDGLRKTGSCSAHPQRSNRTRFHVSRRYGRHSPSERRAKIKDLRAEARASLNAARTLTDLSRLVGVLPKECIDSRAGERICTWKANSRTQGHGTLATAIQASTTKRVALRCSLPPDGGRRGPDSCFTSLGN